VECPLENEPRLALTASRYPPRIKSAPDVNVRPVLPVGRRSC